MTEPTSPSDVETQFETIRRLGPDLLKAFQSATPTEAEVKTMTHACKVIINLRINAPKKTTGQCKNRDLKGVKSRLDSMFENEEAWINGITKLKAIKFHTPDGASRARHLVNLRADRDTWSTFVQIARKAIKFGRKRFPDCVSLTSAPFLQPPECGKVTTR